MAPRSPRPGRAAAPLALACAVLVALGSGPAAGARPFALRDLVAQEALAEIVLTPDARWLLFARRAAPAAGPRFDLGPYNADLRTTLMAADLAAGGAPRPLFPHAAGFGYRAGPLSPDGATLAVWRISERDLQLGVTALGSGEVRWLDVRTETPAAGRTVLWAGRDALIAIAMGPGETPYGLYARQAEAWLPPLRAATARGEASVTALGSGRFQRLRPPRTPKRLVRVDLRTGAAATLATGDFTDLELSPSGRRLAVLERGAEIPLSASRPPQGDFGIAVHEMRLRIVEPETGRVSTPCAGRDVIASLLSWSATDQLLAYMRAPGEPWSAGQLVAVGPEGGCRPLGGAVRPLVAGRPERVRAAWWGDAPIVLGRLPGASRDDWFRLGGDGPVNLTRALAAVPRTDLVITPDGPVIAADGAGWRLGPDGRATRIAAAFSPMPLRLEDIATRAQAAIPVAPALVGRIGDGPEARIARLTAAGAAAGPPAPDGEPVAAASRGAALLVREGGGRERLLWRDTEGRSRVVAEANPHLLDLDRPRPHPVRHPGPGGETLTSWLFLPTAPSHGPPPLVVVPYPGAAHRTPPEAWTGDPMSPTAALLSRGYAVLVPSLPATGSDAGPADGLAARILDIVDAAAAGPGPVPRFDPSRLALWGHSFGAWGSLMAVSRTDRFSAVVATAGRTDLASAYGQFTPWTRLRPQDGLSVPWSAGWTEALQADMRAPPWAAPDRYLANSPVFQAGRIRTPVMLAAGELDGSHLGQAEEMFSALYRQGKDAVLLTYWGEGHGFASPGNILDLYGRALAFLDGRLRPGLTPAADAAAHLPPGSASSGPRTPGRRP